MIVPLNFSPVRIGQIDDSNCIASATELDEAVHIHQIRYVGNLVVIHLELSQMPQASKGCERSALSGGNPRNRHSH
jgi:hypothetical protein